jgi:ADP-ribose pyrophosphatase YjhB (NUDIX family)
MQNKHNFIHTHLSVDCVIFGFDDDQLKILLVQKNERKDDTANMKLPGSLIYHEEDVDDAAHRVLFELTGIKRISLKQFKCYASPNRARNPNDMKWLDTTYQPNINRLITVAYLAICKVDRKLINISRYKAEWWPIDKIPSMPFDHNLIFDESLTEIRNWIESDFSIIFELLPKTFTINKLHRLFESIYDKKIDIRNFHKRIKSMSYVIPLDKKEENVSHRAARYYKFDKKEFNKIKSNIK